MKYLVIYEKSTTGWGAYAPDLQSLGVAGTTLDEVKELIREAMEFSPRRHAAARGRNSSGQRHHRIHHGLIVLAA